MFRHLREIAFWFLAADFILVTRLGANPVEEPYVMVGQFASILYFTYFLFLIPLLGWVKNYLLK